MSTVAEEVENPRRNYPLALAIVVSGVIYAVLAIHTLTELIAV